MWQKFWQGPPPFIWTKSKRTAFFPRETVPYTVHVQCAVCPWCAVDGPPHIVQCAVCLLCAVDGLTLYWSVPIMCSVPIVCSGRPTAHSQARRFLAAAVRVTPGQRSSPPNLTWERQSKKYSRIAWWYQKKVEKGCDWNVFSDCHMSIIQMLMSKTYRNHGLI